VEKPEPSPYRPTFGGTADLANGQPLAKMGKK